MTKTLTRCALWLGIAVVAVLLVVPTGAQNSAGGAFLTNFNYILSGQWTWRRVTPWIIEGATDDAFETSVTFTEPTADRTITIPNATGTVMIAGQASSGKVVAGAVALDGSNPTSVTTGLSSITGCIAIMRDSAPLGDDPVELSVEWSAETGRLDIYAWKHTSGSDATLVASTLAGPFVSYQCVGTP